MIHDVLNRPGMGAALVLAVALQVNDAGVSAMQLQVTMSSQDSDLNDSAVQRGARSLD
jgi:hypothetical protein